VPRLKSPFSSRVAFSGIAGGIISEGSEGASPRLGGPSSGFSWTPPSDYGSIERLARSEDEAADLRSIMADDGMNLKRPVQSARGEVVGWESYPHPAMRELRRIGQEAGVRPPLVRAWDLSSLRLRLRPTSLTNSAKSRAKRRGEPDPGIDARRWS
jgi:hypothetical protein